MNIVIQIFLCVSVLSVPVIFYWIYMRNLEKGTKKIIQLYSDDSSEHYSDLKVWFKNFDVIKKKNKFNLNPYETLYSYSYCDIILNKRNIVVIGKTKFLGKCKLLTPTIFKFENNGNELTTKHVKIENIQEIDSDIEIEFTDENYINTMTFVIRNPEIKLKDFINTRYKCC